MSFWPRRRFQSGSTGQSALYMKYNAMGVVMAEQCHKDQRLTRRTKRAILPPFPTSWHPLATSYPFFPSGSSFVCSVRGSLLGLPVLYTLALLPLSSLALSTADGLRVCRSCHQRTSSVQISPFSGLLRIISTLRFSVSFCFLSRKQKCEIYLNLFLSRFSHLVLDSTCSVLNPHCRSSFASLQNITNNFVESIFIYFFYFVKFLSFIYFLFSHRE